ncbi:Transcriptional regulator, IclR family (plasmid) [Cupriavidus sp. U2]|uniref:IclR family transcriptional regulator n=1 Tax=Cupriavidus sp. U2 TaxID=2920269 RepID=UPI00129E5E5C|nr:helix-turn-helix domain-containing protein [Cupriavidus sp. U2]KAI3590335.1 Transcriptional regulator, IclR family [Cupriavidus sp. U2]
MQSQDEVDAAAGVRVLARGLAVLQAFEPDNRWRSNAELAAATRLPKATVSRLTANLTSAGYLNYSAEKAQYRLASSILALGYFAAGNRELRIVAQPLMQELADRHSASIVLASRDGLSMVCQEVCHSRTMLFTLRVRAGSRLGLRQSALGRAQLGVMPPDEREQVIAALAAADPDACLAERDDIGNAIFQMQSRGFCTVLGTLEAGILGAAVTIDLPGQPYAYSLGCAVPAASYSTKRLEDEVATDLLAAKMRLEHELSLQSTHEDLRYAS